MVTETPEIYKNQVHPYIQQQREAARLDWVFNILEGRKEQKDIIYRHSDQSGALKEAFLLAPDLNWDRETLSSLHLLALVDRRDLWSLRDLNKSHVVWLKHMREKILEATVKKYPTIEKDQLKLYIHCAFVSSGPSLKQLNDGKHRSTHILPPSHPRRAYQARSDRHPSHRQSLRPGKHHLTTRNHVRRRKCRHVRRHTHLHPRREPRPLDPSLPAPQRGREGLSPQWKFDPV